MAVVLVVAGLVAGTAGMSYAKPKPKPGVLDTIVVSNYGAAFGGSIETFIKGSPKSSVPKYLVTGPTTLLGAGTGAALDAVSSLDDHIAVGVPLDLIDLAGFGAPPPPFPGVINPGTGFVEIFPPGANGDSAATSVLGTRNVAFGVPNTSGVNTPQGVAFESPFDGVHAPGSNIVAIANTLPAVIGPTDLNLACGAFANAGCTSAGMACPTGTSFSFAAGACCPTGTVFENGVCHNPNNLSLAPRNFAPLSPVPAACCTAGLLSNPPMAPAGTCQNNLCTGVMTPFACCTGAGAGTCPGFTVGTITEFDTSLLNAGAPGFNDTVPPINNNPVGPVCLDAAPLATTPDSGIVTCKDPQPSTINPVPTYNATIGGCDTFLAGPIGLTFDESGFLFVVNTAALVTGYPPDSSGDQVPVVLIGALPPTAGTLIAPVAVTVESAPTPQFPPGDDLLFVSDAGDNSIKVYDALNFSDAANCFTSAYPIGCVGKLIAVLSGGKTKLKRPEGVALGLADDTLYVANDNNNTISMFSGINETVLSGPAPNFVNVAPNLIIAGKHNTGLNFPVGVALPAFTPSSTETITGVGAP